MVTATKLNQAQRSTLGLQVTTLAGQTITCDPVVAQLVRQKGEPRSEVFRNIAQAESKLRVANGRPGLNKIEVLVNGTRFRLTDLHDGEVRTADVAKAMRPGKQNTITITMHGSRGSRALLVISD